MKYDWFVFDLDGTLLDTLPDLHAAVNAAQSACGAPLTSASDTRAFAGNGVRKLIERSMPRRTDAARLERALAVFRQYYETHIADGTRVYPAIDALLHFLRARGCRIGVLSNKYDAAAQTLCERFFGGTIDCVCGRREDFALKPDADAWNNFVSRAQIGAATACYAGDSDIDAIFARNAKVDFMGAAWGFRDGQSLRAAGAERVFDTPAQMNDFLRARWDD